MDSLKLSSDSIDILGTQEGIPKRRVAGHNAKAKGGGEIEETSEDARGLT